MSYRPEKSVLETQLKGMFKLEKLLITDDAVLMRVKVKTDKEASPELKAAIRRLYLGYFVTFETIETAH